MKFVTLFAASAAAATLVPRAEVDTIKNDINSIRTQVQALESTLSDYTKDDMDTVRSDMKNIILAINAADSDTKALKGPFSDRDATTLATPIQDLGIDAEKAIAALVSKKSEFVAGCNGPEIYQALMDQSMQSASFQTDLMKRLSPDVQTLAKQMAKVFNDSVAKGVAAFTDQQMAKCAAPKPQTTSSIYGAVPNPTAGSSSPSASSSPSGPSPSSPGSNSNTQQPNNPGSSNPNTSNNSTTPSYTAGPAPTGSTIAKGSASAVGASLGFAGIVALAFFLL